MISNFLSLSVLQVLGYIFSFITLPYLAKTLGAENFGKITFASAFIAYFQCIVQWGFRFSAVRDIAVVKDDISKVSRICSRVLWSSIFLMFVTYLLLIVIVGLIPIFKNEWKLILLTSLIMPGYTFFPDWLYQGMERMKFITIMNFVSKLIFTICIFLFISKPDDYCLEPAFQALGQIVPGLIALIYAIKLFGLKLSIVSLREVFSTLKDGFNVFFTQFMPTIYNQLSIVFLGVFISQTSVGIFSAAYKFIGISEQIAAVLSRTFFPFLARRIDKHHVFVLISGSMSLIVSLFLFIGSDFIIDLFFTAEYENAKLILRVLSFGPFLLFLRTAYGMNGLVLIHKDNIYRNIILWCSVLGFVLALLAIPILGELGVAITFVVTWACMGIFSYINFKKNKNAEK